MSISAEDHSKAWYGRQLDRLHREAPAASKTTRDDALRHLPLESLLEVINTTFKDYDTRAEQFADRCIEDGKMHTLHSFMKAHQAIMEQFDFAPPNYYLDMASTIGDHFVRKKEEKLGIDRPTHVEIYVPELPASPCSGPPTPGTVLSWINNIDSASEPPPDRERSMAEPNTKTPGDDFSGGAIRMPRKATKSITTRRPRQRRHPRKAKTEGYEGVAESLPSPRRQKKGKGPGKGRKTAKKEPIPVIVIEEDTNQQPRGTKRQRAGDAVVSSEESQVTQKRRKIAKPSTKPKR